MKFTIVLDSGKVIELTGEEYGQLASVMIGKAKDETVKYPYYPAPLYPYGPNYPVYPYFTWMDGDYYPDNPMSAIKPNVMNCGYNGAPLD